MKKIVLVFCSMLLSLLSKGQEITASDGKGFWNDPINDPAFPLYVIGFLVFTALILTIIAAVVVLRVLNLLAGKAGIEKAARLGIPYVPPQTWWARFWQDINALAPLGEEKNIELDHNYDGIRELDNHLPPWWKGLFYGSMVFAAAYMAVFHLSGSLPLSEQEYQNEVSLAAEQVRMLKASRPAEVIDENKLLFDNNAAMIAKGKSVFLSSNCASCHRNDGGGNAIGPNLTDAYWLHGGDVRHVFTTIKNGVVEKAMPAWGKVMSLRDVRDLAFYVMSLQGTNPQNAKAAQGELFKPKPEPKLDSLSLDSTKVQAKMIKK